MKKFSFAAVLLLSAAVISTGCGRKTGSVGDVQPVMEEVQEDTASYITEEETEPELDDEFTVPEEADDAAATEATTEPEEKQP